MGFKDHPVMAPNRPNNCTPHHPPGIGIYLPYLCRKIHQPDYWLQQGRDMLTSLNNFLLRIFSHREYPPSP